jgi:hypothetical protein
MAAIVSTTNVIALVLLELEVHIWCNTGVSSSGASAICLIKKAQHPVEDSLKVVIRVSHPKSIH